MRYGSEENKQIRTRKYQMQNKNTMKESENQL